MAYVWIALGGALGSVSRYWLGDVVAAKYGESFPTGTLIVNVLGSFVIGVVGALAAPGGRISSDARAFATQFIMIGICGGFTTFSSFSWQTLNLLRDKQWLYAGGNVVLSVVLCMVAVWLGYLAGTAIHSMKGT